jgi:hypothetical protein
MSLSLRLERSYELRGIAVTASFTTVIVAALVIAFAVMEFRKSSQRRAVLAAVISLIAPFLSTWFGGEPNVHGEAILGFFLYLLLMELCGAGLLVSVLVRGIRQKRNMTRLEE